MFDIGTSDNNIVELVAIFYAPITHADHVPHLHLHTGSNLYATILQHQAAP